MARGVRGRGRPRPLGEGAQDRQGVPHAQRAARGQHPRRHGQARAREDPRRGGQAWRPRRGRVRRVSRRGGRDTRAPARAPWRGCSRRTRGGRAPWRWWRREAEESWRSNTMREDYSRKSTTRRRGRSDALRYGGAHAAHRTHDARWRTRQTLRTPKTTLHPETPLENTTQYCMQHPLTLTRPSNPQANTRSDTDHAPVDAEKPCTGTPTARLPWRDTWRGTRTCWFSTLTTPAASCERARAARRAT